MLVDLARNDVGRVARFGTVHVDELMTLERYSHVMHLTSQVSGDLVDGLGPIDVLRATLPAGTVSGAPKVRAMEIIDELEPVKRGPYAGVVGYVDWSGNLDTAIAIRTMFVGPQGASLQAGAGIVADSVPDDEDLECRNKAAALLAAIPAARRMTAARRAAGTRPDRRAARVPWSADLVDHDPGSRTVQRPERGDEEEEAENPKHQHQHDPIDEQDREARDRVERDWKSAEVLAEGDVAQPRELHSLTDDGGSGAGPAVVSDLHRLDHDPFGRGVLRQQGPRFVDQLDGVPADARQAPPGEQRGADGDDGERPTEHHPRRLDVA